MKKFHMLSEKFYVLRALLKQFTFTDLETLIGDIQKLYPAALCIVEVNNDERDSVNVPR